MTVPTVAQLLGGNARAAKFESYGDTIEGTIVSPPTVKQVMKDDGTPGLFPSGDPKWQINIVLQTNLRDDADDDGVRTLYCKSYMMAAVKEATKQAGVTELEQDGWIRVTYIGDGQKSKAMYSAPKLFSAEYRRPAAQAHQGAVANVQAGLGGQALPQQPQQPQYQQPAAQPQYAPQAAPQQPAQPAPAAAAQPTPEAVAALRAAGVDPAQVYPGFVG